MDQKERELAEALASMTVDDFRYLQEHGMIDVPADSSSPDTQVTATQTPATTEPRKRKRRTVKHDWPAVGTILEADYEGQHYGVAVVAAPQHKTGKGLKIVTGPAAGVICRSPTGAMLKATEAQRNEQGLGRKGVANGWAFWQGEGGDDAQSS